VLERVADARDTGRVYPVRSGDAMDTATRCDGRPA
jgi:hypothetical protein